MWITILFTVLFYGLIAIFLYESFRWVRKRVKRGRNTT
jgi:hypothetical protein